MKNHLITESGKKDLSVFVLQGYGGTGKSEVTVKFATDNQDKFVVSSYSR
jgi:MinD superfamily P-loop ATPase